VAWSSRHWMIGRK